LLLTLVHAAAEFKRLVKLLESSRGSQLVGLNRLETELDERVVEVGKLLPQLRPLLREFAIERCLRTARDYRRRHPPIDTGDPELREQARKILDEAAAPLPDDESLAVDEALNPDAKMTFGEALRLTNPAERAAYLDRACAGNPVLRQEVESLLNAHERAGDFLKQTIPLPEPDVALEHAGTRIGRYKLLEQIGEGGFGVVWMAEQEEPVRRRVALKIIKLGMDTKEVVARFEAERQALALMDHPNIAGVFDGGATDTGRPYFVMELVKGIPITRFCDERKLTTGERLELFMQVCHAVQHAHQKGIIHRDLKPSNILVTVRDDRPVPKVIDFGVAKATQSRLTQKTLFTRLQQWIGTPAYMSPEQAGLGSLDVDTRSDIYSLGVLLYELLTGRTPFDTEKLLATGYEAVMRTIREEEPPKPSTRLSTLAEEELKAVAARRGADSAKLGRLVRGDLDWIVMKCLEKDRGRRYETANNVARDVDHYLRQESVSAAAPSPVYKARKFIRRHKVGLAMAGTMVLLLAAGVVVSTLQAVRATRAERAQGALRKQAEAGESKAQDLAEQNRQNLYAARVQLSQQLFEQGDVERVLELLKSLRPSGGETDLRGFEWYYLWGLCHQARFTVQPGAGHLHSVAYSPDGRRIAVVGEDEFIRLYDSTSGNLTATFQSSNLWNSAAVFTPDGTRLVSAGSGKLISVWRLDSLDRGSLPLNLDVSYDILKLAISEDGRWLAAGTGSRATGIGTPETRYVVPNFSGKLLLWDLSTGRCVTNFAALKADVLSLSFSSDGTRLACGSADHSLTLWSVPGMSLIRRLPASDGYLMGASFVLMGAAFVPNTDTLATLVWDAHQGTASVKLWNSSTGKELRALSDSPGPAACFAVSPDGSTLATAGKDHIVRLWDLASGRLRTTLKGHTDIVWALAFAPDAKSLASAAWDGTCRVWDLTRQQTWQLLRKAHSYSAAFSPDSKMLASGGRAVQFWNVADASLASEVPLPGEWDISVAFTPGGMVAAAGRCGRVYLIDPPYDRVLHEWQGHADKIWGLAIAPDGKLLATGGEDGLIKLWELSTRTLKRSITGHETTVPALSFTPDGLQLISGTPHNLKSWDVTTGELLAAVEEQSHRVCISPDGHWLAVAYPGGLSLRELPSLKLIKRMRAHSDLVWNVAFSGDNRTIATASWDGTAVLWHRASGQPLLSLPASAGVAWCAAFAPDGSAMAVGSGLPQRGEISLLYAPRSADHPDPAPKSGPVASSARFPISPARIRAMTPTRNPSTPANLIDLTAFYNGSLTSGWIPSSPYGRTEERNLGELPTGVQRLGDVSFDVRGLVQLAGRALNGLPGAHYPRQVSGIPIGRKCRRLHILHGTGWGAAENFEIGRLVLHHRDGQVSILPIKYGEDVRDWWVKGSDNGTTHAMVAWTGYNAATRQQGLSLRLYRRTWDNPHPDVVLDSVDYESTFSSSSPFLIALTVE